MAKQYGFFVDMDACYGCRTCSMACKSENNTPAGVLWHRVREFRLNNPKDIAYIPMSCNHCDDPQCLKVCPVQAYSKRLDGIVQQDHSKCIGCKLCISACPYSAPVFDPAENKTSKCDMCAALVDQGMQPSCVESCPGKVLQFGEVSELRKKYGADLTLVEKTYGLPDHTISRPNIVIAMPRKK